MKEIQNTNEYLESDTWGNEGVEEKLIQTPHKRVSAFGHGKEISEILDSISILVVSGMDIGSVFASLSREAHTRFTKTILNQINESIDSGSPLWKALEECGVFEEHTISFIKLGEESGRLPETMQLIVEQTEKDRAFRSQVRSALLYPFLVLGVSGVVGLGITWFIIPRLAVTFSQLHVKLPLLTRIMIAAGEFLIKYGYFAVPLGVVFIVFLLYLCFVNKKFKFIGQAILFNLPVFKTLLKEMELARFGYNMGNLVSAGMPIIEAIGSLKSSSDFRRYVNFYAYLEKGMSEGNSFDICLKKYHKLEKLIPYSVQDMLVNAEQSGKLAETFSRIGKTFDAKIETTSKNLTILLEPIMLLVVWAVVMFIALAIIMPIYTIFDGIQNTTQAVSSPQPVPSPAPTPVATSSPEESHGQNQEPKQEITKEPLVSQSDTEDVPLSKPPVIGVPEKGYKVIIGKTPTGYLNVRNEPIVTSEILFRVYPSEEYAYSEYKNGWYKIELKSGKVGWVTERYVSKIE